MNFYKPSSNSLSFEIRMRHTNHPTVFEFAGGQYFFDFNPAIANGGLLSYKYDGDTSDLPLNFRPRNPTISGDQLRLAVNTFPGAGNGYTGMQTIHPGTLIVRMKLSTTAATLANVPLKLRWRDYTIANPNPKIFAYVGASNFEITNADWHSIDSTIMSSTQTIVKFGIEGLMLNAKHRLRDTVFVQFRNVVAPYSVVHSGWQILDSATLTATVNSNIPPGNYYIVVRNKNSIETWSKPGGEPLGYGTNFYDFTIAASQAYGGNLVLRNGLYCIYTGNVNGDDIIDAEDMLIVDNAVFNFADGSSIANLNGDGIVDIEDMAIIDRNAREIRVVERPGASASQLAKRKILVE
jgi:hypothetical protein